MRFYRYLLFYYLPGSENVGGPGSGALQTASRSKESYVFSTQLDRRPGRASPPTAPPTSPEPSRLIPCAVPELPLLPSNPLRTYFHICFPTKPRPPHSPSNPMRTSFNMRLQASNPLRTSSNICFPGKFHEAPARRPKRSQTFA